MNNQTKGALLAHGPLGLFLSSTTPIPDPVTPASVHELVKLAALNAETLERFEVALHSALMLWAADTSAPSTGLARTPDSVEQRVRDAMARVERAVSDRTNVVLEAARLLRTGFAGAPTTWRPAVADTKTLDEHAETVKRLDAADARLAEVFGPRPESVRAVRDAYEAERAARVALETRVRELEADQDQAAQAVVDAQASEVAWKDRADKAEATLAETRAQLARLREAASELVRQWDIEGREVASSDLVAIERAEAGLMTALSTPGPTLAEIRRAAQVAEWPEWRGKPASVTVEANDDLRAVQEEAAECGARSVTLAPIDAWLEQLLASATGVDEAMAVLLTLVRDGVAPSDPELFDKTRAAARTVTRAKLARETPK